MDNLNARAAAAAAATTTTTTTTTSTGPVAGVGGLSIVTPTKSPEAESETPPPRIQSTKPFAFSNGVLKRHAPAQVVYKECRKNHAASLGGHALDGCGEFMPAPTATASDPTSLKCAACGCHRNFHRHEPEDSSTNTGALAHAVIEYHPHHRHHPLPPPQTAPPAMASRGARSPGSQSPPPISSTYYPGSAPHMLLALSTGGVGGNGAEVNNNGPHPLHHHQHPLQQNTQHLIHHSNSQPSSRKRFRTKFTQEQKDKMHDFAEKVGWKMQKTNEDMVNGFCNEIGVERGVFKVWMHNNKNTFGKIRSNTTITSTDVGLNCGNTNPSDVGDHNNNNNNNPTGTDEDDELANLNGNGNSNSSSINNSTHHHDHHIHHHHHHQQYNGKRSNESNAPTNGSSSSS
ncbi:hypothetical protein BVRB_2g046790 [Beta vulgaris subsp. vulgaris]|nr:hypothetical protein BVRB_2g046790 [Beta vulgaris subsp. vulgaris]